MPTAEDEQVQPWSRHLPADLRDVDVLREESLPTAWLARWLEAPDAVVLAEPGGRRVTSAQLEDESRAVAGRLAGAGLVAGDRIVLSASASVDLVVAYVAAHRLGLITVPVNTAYGASELQHVLRITAPRAAIVDDRTHGRAILRAAAEPIEIFGGKVEGPKATAAPLDRATRTTPALICHTSGTTGRPKGAVLTSGNLLASAEAVRIAWRWSPDDHLALMLPLFHLHGLGVGLNGTLVSGATVLLLGGFDPGRLHEAVATLGATMFFGVPTMYHRLASSPHVEALRPLRLCVSGSAPLPAEVHERIHARSGQRVLERYGMTETVMNVSNPYEGERRAGTVGFPLPGVDVRLAGGDGGEIQVRGQNVFPGYWNDPEATAQTFTADGWLRTGDLGTFDADGYLTIVGRSKELIITGGYNVYPREVEDVLREHPAVLDVAVVGVPSPEWGETVAAMVVPRDDLTAESLTEFTAARLAPYNRPRLLRFADDLPRNALGKIQRDELRRQLS
jgi:malonyl-CoA/methylmalonyl-CoA synthetase